MVLSPACSWRTNLGTPKCFRPGSEISPCLLVRTAGSRAMRSLRVSSLIASSIIQTTWETASSRESPRTMRHCLALSEKSAFAYWCPWSPWARTGAAIPNHIYLRELNWVMFGRKKLTRSAKSPRQPFGGVASRLIFESRATPQKGSMAPGHGTAVWDRTQTAFSWPETTTKFWVSSL